MISISFAATTLLSIDAVACMALPITAVMDSRRVRGLCAVVVPGCMAALEAERFLEVEGEAEEQTAATANGTVEAKQPAPVAA